MSLLALDFVIIGVLLISAALSLIRGFTKEALSIIGWVVSGYAAIFLGPMLQPLLVPYVKLDWVVNAGSILIVFLVVLVVFSLSVNAFSGHVKSSGIDTLDRSLGVMFGLARGVFIVSMGYFIAVLVMPEDKHPDWIADAKLRPILQTTTKVMLTIVPMDRLPLSMANINELMEKTDAEDKLREIAEETLREIADSELETLIETNQKQDSASDTGYKQSQRNLIRRLIQNSEGVK